MKVYLYQDSNEEWQWDLVKGDEVVARSPSSFATEAKCRSQLAVAKRSMAGAKFAKIILGKVGA